ncbi:MAG: hypothetical protein IID37_12960 [Planctomycetes bacterium]|nr:hypothetical protein [Planctomycetota bacterium]
MSERIPESAQCRSCGYRLRDLPDPVCPECGRGFDPGDSKTYIADPDRRRRRRWLGRLSVVAAIILLALGFFPRRVLTGSISFTCPSCGEKITTRRWEPVPPSWISLRYPGFHWTTRSAIPSATPVRAGAVCTNHNYSVNVRAEFHVGSVTGSAAGGAVFVNGQRATPATAVAVLKTFGSPSNRGITIGPHSPGGN